MPISQIVTNSIANGAVVAADLAAGAALSNLGTSQLADANMAPGSVIQVVNRTTNVGTTTTGTSFVATDIFATITPTFASSRIVAMGSVWCATTGNTVNTVLTLYRDSTNLVATNYGLGSIYASSSSVEAPIGFNWVDSPNTVSAVTYRIYVKRMDASGTAVAGNSDRTSQITLMEIAA